MNNFKKRYKIVLTGPESCGKTTLAASLASHYQTDWVPEYARGYLSDLKRDYTEKDILEITKFQLAAELAAMEKVEKFLFCDTSMVVLKVWSEVKYGRHYPLISNNLKNVPADLYLLCRPDIPWTYDPLRENPYDREFFFEIYQKELNHLSLPYVELAGSMEKRMQIAISAINAVEVETK